MVFVDSNVILDVITADPRWRRWSEEQLGVWLDRGPLLINPIVDAPTVSKVVRSVRAVNQGAHRRP